jgi:hypothetical protein
MSDSINHPRFTRINKTEYAVINPGTMRRGIVHVGQIFKYLTFDKALRDGRTLNNVPGIPLGYLEFAKSFNDGAQDRRRLSTFNDTGITKSHKPVFLCDFAITAEQCGLDVHNPVQPVDSKNLVFEEYATTMALRDKKRRDAIQERKNKTHSLFDKPGSYKNRSLFDKPGSYSKKRKHYNYHDDDYESVVFDLGHESSAAFSISDFDNIPHASTSNLIPEQTTSVAVASASFFPALLEQDPSQSEFLDSLAILPIHGEDETLAIHDEDETLHSESNEEMQE